MSRVGKQPIIIPDGVEVNIENEIVKVKGPKGELMVKLIKNVFVEMVDKEIRVKIADETDGKQLALWGLFRSLINNLVVGVTEGFIKELEINGIGFKAEVRGNILVLNVGFSHPVNFEIPEGIKIEVKANVIAISGIDKHLVGETAAIIRKIKKPEPYKGKGIKYMDEVIVRKVGKTAGKTE
ncbi:50S ribosomal protein L6 [Candidatus Falkowbacteria bacterium RIFOXYD2_FULL_35_9]|uniref:Large ribosomal subunit protein uL6 n=1 Tax=Candidatus Falkowbacteria bacterium RIFOXYC2_FULL_36_12 TaxID=1798002 RepID=A0A1F5SW57_9BACT|nr:MAG: 50S ribosomal protein L6 [Candidatus Falkowbacteria bacterium RIFOXYB2_FULL_35_7]OGF30968.1 MAG: 50S ribosomal protein L6 [Candidatus Falkowbacteria bacterium RIFOXYC2_FULL_36_12]OGF34396.1 MAG: 50S ribosomal protein L6 [Candidatus Falkowbacteria bacterium RIFOXYA2_FULL_35_8]OGF47292.1 MAG: 50S ribosomal protein L6 [Candidatus Falkowbacteria bacterium RIFOXYD2_FULL_35_9]